MTFDLFPDPDRYPYLTGLASLALIAVVYGVAIAGGWA